MYVVVVRGGERVTLRATLGSRGEVREPAPAAHPAPEAKPPETKPTEARPPSPAAAPPAAPPAAAAAGPDPGAAFYVGRPGPDFVVGAGKPFAASFDGERHE